jgi:HD-like signal output (HDOD) protein
MRVLFVDDEPRILDGLQRTLRQFRSLWEMSFANGGEEGLRELEAGEFDVVVSDMRMPKMDGAQFLAIVAQRWPRTLRIVLSGQTDKDSAARVVKYAHQFLTKPCDPTTLRQLVERHAMLQTLLADTSLQELVGGVSVLPTLPSVSSALRVAVERPEVSLNDIAQIITNDGSVTAKILQIVNSSFFGLAHRVVTVEQAINYLGLNIVQSLVMAQEIGLLVADSRAVTGFSLARYQRHAWLAASIARRIAPNRALRDEAFTAALLHDVGKLLLVNRAPKWFEDTLWTARAEQIPLFEAERNSRGVTHAEVGAYLLGLWALPASIVEAVAHHHVPARVKREGSDLVALVHTANVVAHELLADDEAHGTLDREFLGASVTDSDLDEWRAVGRELAGTDDQGVAA